MSDNVVKEVKVGVKIWGWTVLKEVPSNKNSSNRGKRFLCQCECGTVKEVAKNSLKSGKSKACGCTKNKKARERMAKHGMGKHPLYNTWKSMKNRCLNKNDKDYVRYGGRGITMNPDWADVKIYIKDMEDNLGERPNGMTVDRIDNDKGYYIENLRYANASQQSVNQRHAIGSLGSEFKNITMGYEGRTKGYEIRIKRDGFRRYAYTKNLEEAVKIRDMWISEYEKNKTLWVERTKNKKYKKEV